MAADVPPGTSACTDENKATKSQKADSAAASAGMDQIVKVQSAAF